MEGQPDAGALAPAQGVEAEVSLPSTDEAMPRLEAQSVPDSRIQDEPTALIAAEPTAATEQAEPAQVERTEVEQGSLSSNSDPDPSPTPILAANPGPNAVETEGVAAAAEAEAIGGGEKEVQPAATAAAAAESDHHDHAGSSSKLHLEKRHSTKNHSSGHTVIKTHDPAHSLKHPHPQPHSTDKTPIKLKVKEEEDADPDMDPENYEAMSNFAVGSLTELNMVSAPFEVLTLQDERVSGGRKMSIKLISMDEPKAAVEKPPEGMLGALARRMSFRSTPDKAASPSSSLEDAAAAAAAKPSLLKSLSRRFSLRGSLLGSDDDDGAASDKEKSTSTSTLRAARMATATEEEDEEADDAQETSTSFSAGGGGPKSNSKLGSPAPKGMAAGSSPSKRPSGPRRTTWKNLRGKVAMEGRVTLERNLWENIADPDLNVVIKLAHSLIDSKHHSSASAYSGALLMEWAVYRGFQLSLDEQRLLAKAHAEVWISRGIAAESYNLDRAKYFYEACIAADKNTTDAAVWIEYSRVLSYFGEKETSASILKQIVSNFDDDPDLSSYLFCLAAALKACGRFDEASNYFFEATMTGPPKHFNKLQMMFIISRNIEEESKNLEGASDDAYLMVFQHLQLEGLIDEQLTYEDWISDSSTWRKLGDMCALHGAHSLACDLYGQGLMRDPWAFKKPKLWFGFAKACRRCGRTADAQLAVKQALTMDPFNQQLLRAAELSDNMSHEFEALIEEEELGPILKTFPKTKMGGLSGALKLQAMQRGKSERRGLRAGLGNFASRSSTGPPKKMMARVGVLLGGVHPVMLTAKATWMGTISEIVATDIDGQTANLKFKNAFTPIKETGTPRALSLTFEAMPDEGFDRHILVLRFVDQETGEYVQRSLTLSYREHDAEGHLVHMVHQKGQIEDEETDKAAERHVGKDWSLLESLRFKDDHDIRTNIVDAEVERGCFLHHGVSYLYHVMNQEQNTMVKIFQACSDRQIVFQMQREHLDRNKELKKSVVKLMDIVHAYPRLQDILVGRRRNVQTDSNTEAGTGAVAGVGAGAGAGEGEGEGESSAPDSSSGFWHNTHGNREGVIYSGKKLVMVRILPDVHGETIVRLFEANGCPLLGHAIEDVDAEALTQDLPSRKKRRDRERAVALILGKEDPGALSVPLFSAPIQAVVVSEVATPREASQASSGSPVASSTSAAGVSAAALSTSTSAAVTLEPSKSGESAAGVEPGMDLGDDEFDDGASSPETAPLVSQPKRKAGKPSALDRLNISPMDTPNGSPRVPGTPGSVRFDEDQSQSRRGSVGFGSGGGGGADDATGEETPMFKRSRKRRQGKDKDKDRDESAGEGDEPGPTVIKMASKSSSKGGKDDKAKALQPMNAKALQPIRARVVPQRERESPEKADKIRKQKDEQKRAKEQAAQQALNYMRHQQDVSDAKEYILDRVRKAIWSVGSEEARAYLLQRVAQAKQIVADELVAAALLEATEQSARAKREEEEAYEAAKQTALKVKGGTRASMREKDKDKDKDKDRSKSIRQTTRQSSKGRASGKSPSKDQAGGTAAFLDPSLFDPAFAGSTDSADGMFSSTAASDDQQLLTRQDQAQQQQQQQQAGEGEDEDDEFGEDDAADPGLGLGPGSPGQLGASSDFDGEGLEDSFGDSYGGEEGEEGGEGQQPKRASRRSIPKAREAPPRPPKKITINHPPALTARQRQELRREWGPEDVPAWAYDSPGDLVAALRGFYEPPPPAAAAAAAVAAAVAAAAAAAADDVGSADGGAVAAGAGAGAGVEVGVEVVAAGAEAGAGADLTPSAAEGVPAPADAQAQAQAEAQAQAAGAEAQLEAGTEAGTEAQPAAADSEAAATAAATAANVAVAATAAAAALAPAPLLQSPTAATSFAASPAPVSAPISAPVPLPGNPYAITHAHLPPHLLALLDPRLGPPPPQTDDGFGIGGGGSGSPGSYSNASLSPGGSIGSIGSVGSIGSPDKSGYSVGGGSLAVLRQMLRRMTRKEAEQLAQPRAINAGLSATAFRQGGLLDVSVATDERIEAFKRQQLAAKQARAQARGAGAGAGSGLDAGGSTAGSVASSHGGSLGPLALRGREAAAAAAASQKGKGKGGKGKGQGQSQGQSRELPQVTPPPRGHAPSPFDPPRLFDPLSFLPEHPGQDSTAAGQAAVAAFDARGYADGASPYGSLWRLKLLRCAELLGGPQELCKRIAALQKACPLLLSKPEAYCALADSGGSATEALGRLADIEFLREVKTVCVLLPVASILTRFAGDFAGSYSFAASGSGMDDASSVGGGSTNASGSVTASASGSRRTPRPFRSVAESPHMRAVRGVVTATPTLIETSLVEASHLEPLGADNNATGSPSAPRISGQDSRRLLPHLGMAQASPTVKARGTTVRLAGKAEPPRVQPKVSPLSAAGMGVGVGRQQLSPGLGFGSDLELELDLDLEQPSFVSSSALSSLSQLSPGGASPIHARRKQQALMAVDSDGSVAPVVPYTKSLRLAQAIDVLYEQAPPSMVVMCRRDAMRAAAEEVLHRSPHKKIRDASNKRAKAWEKYSARLEEHGSPAAALQLARG